MKCSDCQYIKVCSKNKTSPVKGCKSGVPLRKCPFCGIESGSIITKRTFLAKKVFIVVCNECKVQTDERPSIAEVVKLWNTRR